MAEKGVGCSEEAISWNKITNQTVPTVFTRKISKWDCLNWSIDDWADKCGDITFKFRCDSKSSEKQWETQNIYTSAKLTDFSSWQQCKTCELPDDHPFKDFDSESFWCYSSYNYMAELFKNDPHMLDIVDWRNLGLPSRGGYESTLWIGSRGSFTPCHQDSYGSNLVAQVMGEKLWIIYPPDTSHLLYPTRIPYEESSIFSSVNILHPDTTTYPKFLKTKPYIVVLKPGDVLYVPPKWWHFVYCLDTSVSINTWVEHESDDLWRLEESVSRFLMTAFIPKYQNDCDWLNPSEELVSANETVSYLRTTLGRLENKTNNDINKCCYDDNCDTLQSAIEVQSVSFEGFEKEMLSRTNYKRYDALCGQNEIVTMVNCFLADNVVKTICENLLKLNKS